MNAKRINYIDGKNKLNMQLPSNNKNIWQQLSFITTILSWKEVKFVKS